MSGHYLLNMDISVTNFRSGLFQPAFGMALEELISTLLFNPDKFQACWTGAKCAKCTMHSKKED